MSMIIITSTLTGIHRRIAHVINQDESTFIVNFPSTSVQLLLFFFLSFLLSFYSLPFLLFLFLHYRLCVAESRERQKKSRSFEVWVNVLRMSPNLLLFCFIKFSNKRRNKRKRRKKKQKLYIR